jgi:prefoldin subunit 5
MGQATGHRGYGPRPSGCVTPRPAPPKAGRHPQSGLPRSLTAEIAKKSVETSVRCRQKIRTFSHKRTSLASIVYFLQHNAGFPSSEGPISPLTQMDKPLTQMDKPLNQMDKPLNQMDRELNQLDKELNQLDKELNQLDRELNQLDKPLNQLDKLLTQMDKLLNQMDKLLNQMDKTLNQMGKALKQTYVCRRHTPLFAISGLIPRYKLVCALTVQRLLSLLRVWRERKSYWVGNREGQNIRHCYSYTRLS